MRARSAPLDATDQQLKIYRAMLPIFKASEQDQSLHYDPLVTESVERLRPPL
jgi:hypothetical protein